MSEEVMRKQSSRHEETAKQWPVGQEGRTRLIEFGGFESSAEQCRATFARRPSKLWLYALLQQDQKTAKKKKKKKKKTNVVVKRKTKVPKRLVRKLKADPRGMRDELPTTPVREQTSLATAGS